MIADFWEHVAGLARAGHQDRLTLFGHYSHVCQAYWAFLAPWVRQVRAEVSDPRVIQDFEWLAGLAAEFDRRADITVSVETKLASRLPVWIARLQDQIRVEETLRSVIIATPEAMPPAPPTTAAAAEG